MHKTRYQAGLLIVYFDSPFFEIGIYDSTNQNNIWTHLTIITENRPNPRTATPEKKGSTAIGLKNELCTFSFALLFAMMLPHSKHAAYFHENTS